MDPKQVEIQEYLGKDVEKGISRCDGMKKNDRMENLLLFSGYRRVRVHVVGVKRGWGAAPEVHGCLLRWKMYPSHSSNS